MSAPKSWIQKDITKPAGMSAKEFSAACKAARDAGMHDLDEAQAFVTEAAAAAEAVIADDVDVAWVDSDIVPPGNMSPEKLAATIAAGRKGGIVDFDEMQAFVDEAHAVGATRSDEEIKAANADDAPKDNAPLAPAPDEAIDTVDEALAAGIEKPANISDARFLDLLRTALSYGITGSANLNRYMRDHGDTAVVEVAGDHDLPSYIVGTDLLWVPLRRNKDGTLHKGQPRPNDVLRLYPNYSLPKGCRLVPKHIAAAARETGMTPEEIGEEIRRDELRAAVDQAFQDHAART